MLPLASPERGVALTQEEFPATKDSVAGAGLSACLKVSERTRIWWLTRSNQRTCAQVSKHLVAYIEALLVLSPYARPADSRIAAIADAHFQTCLASLSILKDADFKAYMARKADEFFTTYGFVARRDEQHLKRTTKPYAASWNLRSLN